MPKFIDLTGQKFNRLKVLKRVENKNGRIYYLCLCDCGNTKIIRGDQIKNGKIKSCEKWDIKDIIEKPLRKRSNHV